MIKIEHLQKRFREKEVLKDISINFEENNVYAIMAPNGTGKTTLISIMSGFMMQDKGEIIYDRSIKKEDFNVILSGDRNLYMKNTVFENLMYLCILKGMNEKEAKQIIDKEKDKFPIYDLNKDILVENLSYGQKRLVALMSAIVTGAKCIIVDEATDGLDIENRKVLCNAIRSAARGRVIILIAHDMKFVEKAADIVAFMKEGCFVSFLANTNDIKIREVYDSIYGSEE
jgi:ABC-2 type transport system ATP-binding protein